MNDKTTPDETPRRDDTPTMDAPGEETPATWDRHQMETDDAGEPRERDAQTGAPAWNKGEMAEERQDHTRAPLTPTDELDEPAGGLSGHGSNPGGGERWADRDKER
ncbi:MAG: hypothetical protein ABI628_09455 [Chloroflexota bacterium]